MEIMIEVVVGVTMEIMIEVGDNDRGCCRTKG